MSKGSNWARLRQISLNRFLVNFTEVKTYISRLSNCCSITLVLYLFGLKVDFFTLNKCHEAAETGAFDL